MWRKQPQINKPSNSCFLLTNGKPKQTNQLLLSEVQRLVLLAWFPLIVPKDNCLLRTNVDDLILPLLLKNVCLLVRYTQLCFEEKLRKKSLSHFLLQAAVRIHLLHPWQRV